MIEKDNVLTILKESKKAILRKDFDNLKFLSNRTMHSASVFQDDDSLSLAVMIYSLSKIFIRRDFNSQKVVSIIEKMISSLESDDISGFRKKVASMFKLISYLDKKFEIYVEDVISQAKVKKGIKIYDHGISLGQVASILDISLWDLLNYAGNTKNEYDNLTGKTALERIKITEGLFK